MRHERPRLQAIAHESLDDNRLAEPQQLFGKVPLQRLDLACCRSVMTIDVEGSGTAMRSAVRQLWRLISSRVLGRGRVDDLNAEVAMFDDETIGVET